MIEFTDNNNKLRRITEFTMEEWNGEEWVIVEDYWDGFTDLISGYLTNTFQVAPKSRTIILNTYIPEFSNESIDDRILFR